MDFFPADPHPGNLFVNTNGDLVLLDFGMVKNIANDTRVAIIEVNRWKIEYLKLL